MTAYPADFRCAQITPYSLAVDMGLLRTSFDGGNARQRRLYRTMPTIFSLEFVMTVQELGRWQEWVNDNAYDYFIIDNLESYRSGKRGKIASPHNIRFISNLAIDNPVYGWVRVKVQAEGAGLADAPELAWILAGTPALPSAGAWPVSFNFMVPGTLPAGATIARGSTGWYWNAAGVLSSVGNNLPRWTYDPTALTLLGLLNEPAATNSNRNSSMVGAVPGTPGTAPTFWSTAGTLGTLTRTLAVGTVDGLPYLQARFAGTPSANGSYALTFDSTTATAAAMGQTWLEQAWVRLEAGSLANVFTPTLRMYERDAGGAQINSGTVPIAPTGAALRTQRTDLVRTLTMPATTAVQAAISFNYVLDSPVDFTLQIGLPQLVQTATPTSPIVTTNAAVTRAADVLRVSLPDGTYSVSATRAAGTTVSTETSTGGFLRVDVDPSPLQAITATKTGPGVFIIAGTPAAPSAGLISGGTPATWNL